jgi:hypothetical protein
VPVYVDTKTSQAGLVYRNVTQDHAIHDMVCPELTKVPTILVIAEDVMVSADKNLVTIKPTKGSKSSTVDHNITQEIYFIIGLYTLVIDFNKVLVHFFGGIPRPEFGSV